MQNFSHFHSCPSGDSLCLAPTLTPVKHDLSDLIQLFPTGNSLQRDVFRRRRNQSLLSTIFVLSRLNTASCNVKDKKLQTTSVVHNLQVLHLTAN